jgi:hypothetical protein
VREEFLITRQGKQYVLFAGLLNEFHEQYFNKSIETELVQVPNPENGNVAVVKAVVEGTSVDKDGVEERGKFSGIGDASPENVGRNIAPHIIRMAETRAKARALRDAVNVGMTALEEINESESDNGPAPQRQQAARKPQRAAEPTRQDAEGAPTKSQLQRLKWVLGKRGIDEHKFEESNGAIDEMSATEVAEWIKYHLGEMENG